MKHFWISLAFFFLFSSSSWAFSCTELDQPITRQRSNINIELFLTQQSQKMAEAKVKALKQGGDCSRKEQMATLWKNLKNTYFGLGNFVSSTSALYENSCRQKDIEKLIIQIHSFDKNIVDTIEQCKNPNALTEVLDISVQMMKFIRDHDDNMKDTLVPNTNKKFQSYWDEDLYAQGSNICPTESWAEVKKSWCKLMNNTKNFSFLGKSFQQSSQSIAEEERAQQKIAHEEAIKWLQLNLPGFLQVESKETSAAKGQKFQSSLAILFAPIINSFNNIFSSGDVRSSQSTITLSATNTQDSIKLFEISSLLSDISGNYGKSYEAQVYLEKQIHAIRTSAERMSSPLFPKNLLSFMNTLKKTESLAPNQCSVSVK